MHGVYTGHEFGEQTRMPLCVQVRAAQRDTERRMYFVRMIRSFDPSCLVCGCSPQSPLLCLWRLWHGARTALLCALSVGTAHRAIADATTVLPHFARSPQVFVDESHADNHAYRRRRGRARRGRQPVAVRLHNRGERVSIMAAMNSHGFVVDACTVVPAVGIDGEAFIDWVRDWLVPVLKPYSALSPVANSVVVMDNAAIHHDPRVAPMIARTGALLRYLPPYSPDLTPIEAGFKDVKAALQRMNGGSLEQAGYVERNVQVCVAAALESINQEQTSGYFRATGLDVERPSRKRRRVVRMAAALMLAHAAKRRRASARRAVSGGLPCFA